MSEREGRGIGKMNAFENYKDSSEQNGQLTNETNFWLNNNVKFLFQRTYTNLKGFIKHV